MRESSVSVTALSEFATCEIRRMLRESIGDQWTAEDRVRRDAGNREHEHQDRSARAFGVSVFGRLVALSRTAVIIGAPLSLVGLMLNALSPGGMVSRLLIHMMTGPGIVGATLLQTSVDLPERILVYTGLQYMYFLVLVALVRRVFDR